MTILITLKETVATDEIFLSFLKRVKSYLRSSTIGDRLSNLMVINVELKEANHVNLKKAVDMFALWKVEDILYYINNLLKK